MLGKSHTVGANSAAQKSGGARAAWAAPPGNGLRRLVRNTLRGKQLFPPKCILSTVKCVIRGSIATVLLSFLAANSVLAAPPGAIISNQASVEFTNSANQAQVFTSNVVDIVTAPAPSTSSIQLTRVQPTTTGSFQETVGPSACLQANNFINLANPTLVGGVLIDPLQPQQISETANYNLGESIFIRLIDADQNRDFQVLDFAIVTITSATSGDSEVVRLTETGVNTGIFSGYLPTSTGSAVSGDCTLQGVPNSGLIATYIDPDNSNDTSSVAAQLDPLQRVFESRTGTAVSNALIELLDATTGLPAIVFGNDGVSVFPSAITSGGVETDSSGTVYVFGPGQYRFPVVPDGNYRIRVSPQNDFAAPSSRSIAELQVLPGAPFALGPASFGVAFVKNGELSFGVDIPVDPQSTALFLQKRTLTTIAAPGDFVRYELIVENASASGVAPDVTILDRLPAGVRYVPGTSTLDNVSISDPAINMAAGTLRFELGDLAVGDRMSLFYVVEIVAGEANKELINSATAFAGNGLISNESDASIRITEDLFRSTSTLIGRVVSGECNSATFSEDAGVANIRVYLEDGRYAVSDDGGRFHFEGLTPGTHVAQLDPDSVPDYYDIVGCNSATSYAGSAESQYVRLRRGSMARADFYLRRQKAPEGQVNIEMRNYALDSSDLVGYAVTLTGKGNVKVSEISTMVFLPDGVSYLTNSLTVDGASTSEPRIAGPSITIELPDQTKDWSSTLKFTATIDAAVDGELVSKATAKFDSPIEAAQRTPVVETKMSREPAVVKNEGYVLNLNFPVLSAELSDKDQLALGILIENWQGVRDISIQAIGHSDSDKISAANQHRFANNYILSESRARAAADYIATALNIPRENVQVQGRGPDDPVADNTTTAGKQKNRRVEMVLSGRRPKQPSFLEVTQASSGIRFAETKGSVPGSEEEKIAEKWRQERAESYENFARQEEPEITTLKPGIGLLLPARNYLPPLPVTRISVKHNLDQSVTVEINDKSVSAYNFDGLVTDVERTFAISRWAGVPLTDGANTIRAIVRNADGSVAKTVKRTVVYTGAPSRGVVVDDMSVLVADGKTKPVIAVRFFDRSGEKTRKGSSGTFSVSNPYRSWWSVEDGRKNKIVEIGNREPIYRVDDDGVALIELEPTTESGEAVLTFKFENNREQEVRLWLSAEPREWILVGFAEGTVGYNTLSDNQTAAFNAGSEDGYYDDGRVAFFAKGSVKGEYLLTLAFDSKRDRDQTRNQFDSIIDPNAFYSLYADRSEQRFEAASQRKIFVKLEKKQFFALFGDFDTALTYTELARYQRRMNGFHSEYRGENVGYTVFASETDQSLVRDEIRGDGTSGLYQLSSAPIIGNTDNIRLEVRDRFDTGRVLATTPLTRFLDYSIDILDGTLFFKKPVASRDENFNPVFIVAEYESIADANEGVVAGGRASLHFKENRVELGVTHIDDRQEGTEADLTGVDLRWQINDQTEFRAEIAKSNRSGLTSDLEASAHSATVEHQGERVDVRAYFKEVEDDFGLGLQSAAEAGIRKVGIDGRAKIKEHFSFDGEASWQQNLATETIRATARARLRYENGGFNAAAGVVHAEDEFDDGESLSSDLAELGISYKIGDITLRATNSFALSDSADNVDFPTSLVFGADYKVLPGVDVYAEYEDASGTDIDAQMTRLGVRASPWHRAQIDSSISNESTEFGPRVFSNIGLVQGFKLNENWVLDFGVDSTDTIVDPGIRRLDPDREFVSGSLNDDFKAYYLGATYNANLWSANSRLEIRETDSQERLGLLAGWIREPSLGHSMSAGLTLLDSQEISGDQSQSATLRYGWAWRKADSRWSFLNRIDLIVEELVAGTRQEENQRLINNFNANRRISERSQLSLQYAFKYVRSTFDDLQVSGYTDLIGVDYRHGFNRRWDAGVHTSILHSYESRTVDYGFGLDLGFNVRDNMWITVGYNVLGFDDSDFRDARYTAKGPFLQLAIKADQHTLRKIANRR